MEADSIMTPTPAPSTADLLAVPHQLINWFTTFVEDEHKHFAALWGILATAGVVGVPDGAKGGYALMAYAGLAHVAEKLFSK